MATSETSETRVKRKRFKKCFAPGCGANARDEPDKVFFKLPEGAEIRREWALAVGRKSEETIFHPQSGVYCCEDHFNLSEDAGNWLDVQRFGTKARLKTGVFPRRVERRKIADSNSDSNPEDQSNKVMPFEFVDLNSFVDENEPGHT